MRINFHGTYRYWKPAFGRGQWFEIAFGLGLYQGRRADTMPVMNFHYNPRDVDAVILSHAHIDFRTCLIS